VGQKLFGGRNWGVAENETLSCEFKVRFGVVAKTVSVSPEVFLKKSKNNEIGMILKPEMFEPQPLLIRTVAMVGKVKDLPPSCSVQDRLQLGGQRLLVS
jgi:hypothetical protein